MGGPRPWLLAAMPGARAAAEGQVMHDIRAIRENPEAFDEGLRRRGLSPRAESLVALDEKRRAAILALQTAQERRNGRRAPCSRLNWRRSPTCRRMTRRMARARTTMSRSASTEVRRTFRR